MDSIYFAFLLTDLCIVENSLSKFPGWYSSFELDLDSTDALSSSASVWTNWSASNGAARMFVYGSKAWNDGSWFFFLLA